MFFTTTCIQAPQIKFQQSAFPCPVILSSGGNRLSTFPDMQEKSVRSDATGHVLTVRSWCGRTAVMLGYGQGLSLIQDLFCLSPPRWLRITVSREWWMINPCSPLPCNLWFIRQWVRGEQNQLPRGWTSMVWQKANFIPSQSLKLCTLVLILNKTGKGWYCKNQEQEDHFALTTLHRFHCSDNAAERH